MKNKTTLSRIVSPELDGSNVFILDSISSDSILCMSPLGSDKIALTVRVKDKDYILSSIRMQNEKEVLTLLSTDAPILKAIDASSISYNEYADFYRITIKEDSNLEVEVVENEERLQSTSRRLHKEFDDFIYGGHEAYTTINSMGSATRILPPEPGTVLDMNNFTIDMVDDALDKVGLHTEDALDFCISYLNKTTPKHLIDEQLGDNTIEKILHLVKRYK